MADLQWDKNFALDQAGGETELLEELLGLLRQSSASDLEKAREALRAGDPQAVGSAAHSIKGASASLGVEGLRQAAYEIEKLARDGDLARIDLTLLAELIDQLHSLRL